MLKKLITVGAVVGTLGAAAPAFADWYRPVPPPVVVQTPTYGYGYGSGGYYGNDWRAREEWRRHEWERYERARRWQWERHHRHGWGW